MAMTEGTTGPDVVDLLTADHRQIEQLFVELESGTGTPERRRQVAEVMIAELVRHAVAEEQYVYPAARAALGDGDRLAEHEIEEHAQAERTLDQLDGMDPADPRFDVLLGQLTSTIRHHVADEESDLFPRLRAACAPEELAELGRKVELAKKIAPTRPHPSAPDHPPLNKLLDPGAGLVDRMRDALTGRPTTVADLTERSR